MNKLTWKQRLSYMANLVRMLFRGPCKTPKETRARELGQMDRQLTSEEWAEFIRLVQEGHLD